MLCLVIKSNHTWETTADANFLQKHFHAHAVNNLIFSTQKRWENGNIQTCHEMTTEGRIKCYSPLGKDILLFSPQMSLLVYKLLFVLQRFWGEKTVVHTHTREKLWVNHVEKNRKFQKERSLEFPIFSPWLTN